MSTLIVLRGNSGSGKSTVAGRIKNDVTGVRIIEQDYYQKYIVRPKEETREVRRRARMFEDIEAALQEYPVVIVEGIFNSAKYRRHFDELTARHHDISFYFYFNIGFDETLRRHATRPKSAEFGESEMREWYHLNDHLGYDGEIIIDESSTLEEAVELIRHTARI